jgi:hypothetical protein
VAMLGRLQVDNLWDGQIPGSVTLLVVLVQHQMDETLEN